MRVNQRAKKVSTEDISLFSRHIATLLTAGIPLIDGLTLLSESVPRGGLSTLTLKIKADLEQGTTLSDALSTHPQYFDALYCGMVQTGEQSGTLDLMLTRLALYQEKLASLKRKMKKALYYPITVMFVAFIVTSILLVKVVPTFDSLFKSFNAELPFFTRVLLKVSAILCTHGLYLLTGLLGFIMLILRLYRSHIRIRHGLQRLYLKLPLVGPLLEMLIIARFTQTLATTTAAGLPLTDALTSIAKATNHIVYQLAIRSLKIGILEGHSLSVRMKKTNQFPLMVVQMVHVGETSGRLTEMLEKISVIYQEKVDTAVDGLTTLLEPIMMIVLGIIVGGIVIAMYLPIFTMGTLF